MTVSKFENVSSLVDNYQLEHDELEAVINDEQMSDAWSRYHLIGDVIRDDAPANIDLDLSLNIASAIAAEPTVLAPKRKTVMQAVKSNVIKLSKPFGQIAIAASAATLMIMGVQQNAAQNEQIVPSQVVQTMPLFGTAEPVSLNVKSQSNEAKKQDIIEQQRRFQALFADHNQQLRLKEVAETNYQETNVEQVENITQ